MIFVMKFQAAAMGRANIPEDQRVDFSLYVDEFQNFATDSFEGILSEARKYRLNLILANQFMTQLNDKVREAIIGNVGTIISGRIGTTDAELMVKKFSPVFDAEDITKLPNFESVASVMINNVPSAPFSMSLVPPLGTSNPQLADALKRLSAAKYGRPRAVVEQEIFSRLRSGDIAKPATAQTPAQGVSSPTPTPGGKSTGTGSSFLDEWLAKRKKQDTGATPAVAAPSPQAAATAPPVQPPAPVPAPAVQPQPVIQPLPKPTAPPVRAVKPQPIPEVPISDADITTLKINRGLPPIEDTSAEEKKALGVDEISIDVRGNIHHNKDENI
jgi:hypothetical protein